jgi:predicted HD phosphohydrolase
MTDHTVAPFTSMAGSTQEQWDHIVSEAITQQAEMPDRVLGLLRSLAGIRCGFAVDQLQHALQTATLAARAGADDEVVVAALCHDIGKAIGDVNHPAVGAEILAPYVRPEVAWLVRVHQDFQGRHYFRFLGKDPDARDAHRGHPAFELAARFADEWDQEAFDPDYPTLPLDHFEPLVRKIFAAPRRA